MTLPTFLIIGAAKAGTTSLWKYCGEHPRIFMSPVKECCFFSYGDPAVEGPTEIARFAVKTLDEYERMFEGVRDEIAIGEASPEYLRSPMASRRIKDLLPGVKLVVSLREPASRAYSAYRMRARQGRSPADLEEALRIRSEHLLGGLYFERLKRYYDLFGREQIHVCLFDDLSRDPAGTMARLFQFVGVDDAFRPAVETRHNVGAVPRGGWIGATLVRPFARRALGQHMPRWVHRLMLRPIPEFPPELRQWLRGMYRDDVLKVQDLIRRDLSAWLA